MATRLMSRLETLGLTALAASLTIAVPVAQQRGAGASPPLAGLPPGEIVAMFDAYVVVQAQSVLQLDDAQYAPFITTLKTLQQRRRQHQQQRQRVLSALLRLAEDRAASDAGLREHLKLLRDHDARGAAEIQKAYDALDETLTVRQQARFRGLEEQMERRKFEFLSRARQANRPKQQRPP